MSFFHCGREILFSECHTISPTTSEQHDGWFDTRVFIGYCTNSACIAPVITVEGLDYTGKPIPNSLKGVKKSAQQTSIENRVREKQGLSKVKCHWVWGCDPETGAKRKVMVR